MVEKRRIKSHLHHYVHVFFVQKKNKYANAASHFLQASKFLGRKKKNKPFDLKPSSSLSLPSERQPCHTAVKSNRSESVGICKCTMIHVIVDRVSV